MLGGGVYTWVSNVCGLKEGKKVFLYGHASFCRFGSFQSGNFVHNSTSKIVELALPFGVSTCIAVAAESPVIGQESDARGQIG